MFCTFAKGDSMDEADFAGYSGWGLVSKSLRKETCVRHGFCFNSSKPDRLMETGVFWDTMERHVRYEKSRLF